MLLAEDRILALGAPLIMAASCIRGVTAAVTFARGERYTESTSSPDMPKGPGGVIFCFRPTPSLGPAVPEGSAERQKRRLRITLELNEGSVSILRHDREALVGRVSPDNVVVSGGEAHIADMCRVGVQSGERSD